MTGWTVTFIVAALIGAMLGYGGIGGQLATIGRFGVILALIGAVLTGAALIRRQRRRSAAKRPDRNGSGRTPSP